MLNTIRDYKNSFIKELVNISKYFDKSLNLSQNREALRETFIGDFMRDSKWTTYGAW